MWWRAGWRDVPHRDLWLNRVPSLAGRPASLTEKWRLPIGSRTRFPTRTEAVRAPPSALHIICPACRASQAGGQFLGGAGTYPSHHG